MITVSLVLIVALVSSSNLVFLHKAVVQSEINKLYAACMYMQRLAQMTNSTQRLTFNSSDQSYSFADKKEFLSKQIRFGVLPGSKGPPSSPKNSLHNPITFENQCITFMPHGMMQSGTVYMIDAQKTIMYALSSPIADFSYLRIYRYDGSWSLVE